MIFNRKKKNIKCEVCSSKVSEKYTFCPYCGSNQIDSEAELKDFGMLGKNDITDPELMKNSMQNFGLTDKIIGSLVNSLVKNLDKQFKNMDPEFEKQMKNTQVKAFPNGIRIKIGPQGTSPQTKKSIRNTITQQQLDKISSLPRTTAKTNIRRLSNKVIYELGIPGIQSPQDVFVSKTESGYEVKAIGSEKVYINSLPIDLQMKGFSIAKDKLLVEFNTEE